MSGQMATTGLGELMDMPNIARIDPAKTKFLSAKEINGGSLIFRFIEIDEQDSVTMMIIVYASLMLNLFIVIIITKKTILYFKKKEAARKAYNMKDYPNVGADDQA